MNSAVSYRFSRTPEGQLDAGGKKARQTLREIYNRRHGICRIPNAIGQAAPDILIQGTTEELVSLGDLTSALNIRGFEYDLLLAEIESGEIIDEPHPEIVFFPSETTNRNGRPLTYVWSEF